jgi:hypothetical protein
MSDVRHQASWRLTRDGQWEVALEEELVERLPPPLMDRVEVSVFDDDIEDHVLRCEAREVPEIMAAIVAAAGWWEPRRMIRWALRGATAEVEAIRAALDETGVKLSRLAMIGNGDGTTWMSFSSDERRDALGVAFARVPNGLAMLPRLTPVHEEIMDGMFCVPVVDEVNGAAG